MKFTVINAVHTGSHPPPPQIPTINPVVKVLRLFKLCGTFQTGRALPYNDLNNHLVFHRKRKNITAFCIILIYFFDLDKEQ